MRAAPLLLAALLLPACLKESEGGVEGLPAPSSLSATPVDGARVSLRWIDASSSESGFRVDVADTPLLTDADVDHWTLLPADVSSFTYDARPNTTTWFRVLAVRGDRQSAPSNVASATTPDVPVAPARCDAIAGVDDSDHVTVAWDDLAGESAYAVEREEEGAGWAPLASLGPNATSFTDRGARVNGAYRYRVRGVNANGGGSWAVSPRASTRDTSWDRNSASGGDLSWNMGLAALPNGFAFVSCYDAAAGRAVLASASPGWISADTIEPGFPATLGYGGTSVIAGGETYVAAADAHSGRLLVLASTPAGWRAEAVDDAGPEDRPILRKSPAGEPRLAYRRDGRLRFASRIDGAWIREPIRESDVVDHFDFVMTPSGEALVAYRRPTSAGLHELIYARKAPGQAWSFETLPAAADPEMLSMAATSDGAAVVAYNTLPSGELRLLSKSGGAWRDERVHASPRGSWGRYSSVAVDPASGEIHVVYSDNLHGALRYAGRKPGGSWRLDLIDAEGEVGRHAVLALNEEGDLIAAYGDATRGALKVAMTALRPPSSLIASPVSPARIDLTWVNSPNATEEWLERSEDGGLTWTPLARVEGGRYADASVSSSGDYAYRVTSAHRFGGRASSNIARALPLWRRDVEVPGSSSFGSRPSLDVGPDGTEHVAHMDTENGDILYSVGRPDAPAVTLRADGGGAANLWSTQGALDVSSGVVDLVAFQFGGGGVRHTRILGLTPTTSTVDAQSLTAVNPCVKAAPDGTLHAVYNEQIPEGQALRHAVRGPSGWTSSRITADPFIFQNQASCLAIGRDGRPRVVLSSLPGGAGSGIRMMYGYSDGRGGWLFSKLSEAPEPGATTVLALGGDDSPHVLYVSAGGGVVYARPSGSDWTFEAFPRALGVSGLPALAVDPLSGRVHVAYGEGGRLLYHRRDPGGPWVSRVLDDSAAVGDVALALDVAGHPHIAYHLSGLGKLRLTSGNP